MQLLENIKETIITMMRLTIVQENYEEITTSEKGYSNGIKISLFGIKVKSKQISTWDYVILKMKIRDDSSKDWINEGYNFSKDFWQF
ncbi:hypothetical protein RhiirA4_484593 [Rhizophagus irregularis]|uniref:Uncharacterized protein n=1 Tax=Rhizophagus irregularis TaxID=588596 RepID=A0A2I1HP30_9GLOM|nr:hypothetical protein RhiirA4_484593 [Rhizophagus irregularis]